MSTMPELPKSFDVHYDVIDHQPFPIFSDCQMEQYGLDCAEYARNQALKEAQDMCRVVQDQVVQNASTAYSIGREMGAVVCCSKIKEVLK